MPTFSLLHYAIIFLVVALIAAAAGFGGVAKRSHMPTSHIWLATPTAVKGEDLIAASRQAAHAQGNPRALMRSPGTARFVPPHSSPTEFRLVSVDNGPQPRWRSALSGRPGWRKRLGSI
jgi:Protein of unknown function (DUF1328)